MVLADDNFATIVKAVKLGRWIYDNIKKYLVYLLRCNIVEIIVLALAVLVLGDIRLLPLSAVAILYINLITDGLPAIALGLSPPDPDIMQRPPRDPKESFFARDVMLPILGMALLQSPLLLGLFLYSLNEGIMVARTRLFLTFLGFELPLIEISNHQGKAS